MAMSTPISVDREVQRAPELPLDDGPVRIVFILPFRLLARLHPSIVPPRPWLFHPSRKDYLSAQAFAEPYLDAISQQLHKVIFGANEVQVHPNSRIVSPNGHGFFGLPSLNEAYLVTAIDHGLDTDNARRHARVLYVEAIDVLVQGAIQFMVEFDDPLSDTWDPIPDAEWNMGFQLISRKILLRMWSKERARPEKGVRYLNRLDDCS
jgi:hypothetical protein